MSITIPPEVVEAVLNAIRSGPRHDLDGDGAFYQIGDGDWVRIEDVEAAIRALIPKGPSE